MHDGRGLDAPVRVVIVDDHRMFADGLARILADEPDLEVVGQAGTPDEALTVVEACGPDVVLLDHLLPGRSGVEVAVELKALRPQTMIVMVSGFFDDRVLVSAIEAGCSGFLSKESLAGDVAAAVRSAATGEVVIPPALLSRLLPQMREVTSRPGSSLSPRELEVLQLAATGVSNQAIADELHLSVNTVRNHMQAVLTKVGAHTKLEAVSIAVREGIIRYPE